MIYDISNKEKLELAFPNIKEYAKLFLMIILNILSISLSAAGDLIVVTIIIILLSTFNVVLFLYSKYTYVNRIIVNGIIQYILEYRRNSMYPVQSLYVSSYLYKNLYRSVYSLHNTFDIHEVNTYKKFEYTFILKDEVITHINDLYD